MFTLRFSALTLVVLMTHWTDSIQADEPQGVVRTFMIVDLVDENVDFSDEDSVLLKVNNSSNSIVTKNFITAPDHPLSAFSGASFGFGVSAMYMTRGFGDTPVGVFGWLLDENTPAPPPTGSVALLGPDVLILQTETIHWYSQGNFIYPTGDESESSLTIVTAIFTK